MDKPIDAKDQVNDGQTQHTEQTMESSAAMKVRHTASALPEVTKHILVTNSPIPTRIPTFPCYNSFLNYHKLPLLSLPNPNLYTFLLHIYKNTTNLAFKISVNSQLTETHIYNNLNDPILPLHTIILPLTTIIITIYQLDLTLRGHPLMVLILVLIGVIY